ncbi:MAG: hypothetical protein VX764_05230 [Planctomycetota bacterium]|nr:hypothetical protein [Planctomycetota bacterium]
MKTNTDRPSELARWLLPVFLLAVIGGILIYAKDEVDRRLARAGGAWLIHHDSLPDWFPAGFKGQLSTLQTIPSRVSLQSIRWREETTRELLKNPWVATVDRIERTATGIGFDGQFHRPSVGVRCDGGWLLVDGIGKVIDFQEGDFLGEEWRIPEYIPEQGVMHRFDPGQLVGGTEFAELLSLTGILWQDRVFDRVPGFIREIAATRDSVGERMWRFHTSVGIPLHWGRAPASGAPKVSTTEQKLMCLRQVLEVRDRLQKTQDVQGISLCSGAEPLVTEQW